MYRFGAQKDNRVAAAAGGRFRGSDIACEHAIPWPMGGSLLRSCFVH
jgi:hypothetical protein